jgi:hypothetical protein
MRQKEAAKAAAVRGDAAQISAPGRCSQTWAMLIKRVYEIDPLACPQCGGKMKVIAFLEPPQGAVIEKIMRHCGLWNQSAPRAPPAGDDWVYYPDDVSESQSASSDELRDVTCVDLDTFWATF